MAQVNDVLTRAIRLAAAGAVCAGVVLASGCEGGETGILPWSRSLDEQSSEEHAKLTQFLSRIEAKPVAQGGSPQVGFSIPPNAGFELAWDAADGQIGEAADGSATWSAPPAAERPRPFVTYVRAEASKRLGEDAGASEAQLFRIEVSSDGATTVRPLDEPAYIDDVW